ncbi:MAG: cyclase family protein [Acidobacteria bacterium]|nr:cyclase family protein [Acidobacteriota bacterium]
MRRSAWIVLLAAVAVVPAAAQKPARKLIDLTHAFSSESIYWPTADGFRLKTDAEGVNEKGYYYSAYSFSAAEHGGTHMDAPVHFARGMPSIDRIPLERLWGPGVLVDVQQQAAADRDYQVTEGDLTAWETRNGRIPDGCMLMIRTGWGSFYPDKEKYLGTAQRGEAAVANLHFPGLHPKAAEWIVRNRAISAIAIDTASIDYGQSQLFETHRVLYEKGIFAIENVAHMDRLPVKGFEVIALPMKIEGGSGAPVRIIAVLP